jgi:hypothetical protein
MAVGIVIEGPFVLDNTWQMAIGKGGGISGILACMEISSGHFDYGMLVWRYTTGTLYLSFYISMQHFSSSEVILQHTLQ